MKLSVAFVLLLGACAKPTIMDVAEIKTIEACAYVPNGVSTVLICRGIRTDGGVITFEAWRSTLPDRLQVCHVTDGFTYKWVACEQPPWEVAR